MLSVLLLLLQQFGRFLLELLHPRALLLLLQFLYFEVFVFVEDLQYLSVESVRSDLLALQQVMQLLILLL
jgi:hypothetical protein